MKTETPATTAKTGPLVSIIVNNHNYGRYLSDALESALAQSYPNCEVIAVDDGSTDESRDVLERYGDAIHAIFKENGGQPSALNVGVRHARGEILVLLDSDDALHPDKVRRVVEAFEQYPASGWVYHELAFMNAAGETLGEDAPEIRDLTAKGRLKRRKYTGLTPIDERNAYLAGVRPDYVSPSLSALAFRRAAVDAIFPVPEDLGPAGDEFPKWAAVALFPGVHIAEPLTRQRLHDANHATARRDASKDRALRYIATLAHLRSRFPQLAPSTDRMAAAYLGQVAGAAGWQALAAEGPARRYWVANRRDLIRHLPRLAAHATRAYLARSRPAA